VTFLFNANAPLSQQVGKALAIGRFEQAGAQLTMRFDRALEKRAGQLGFTFRGARTH